MGLPAPHR
jgi:HSP20 family molecular chaperone IbpA